MSSGYKNAVRLIRTEMNFVNNSAAYDSMDECGITYYEFIAVLDNRTSKVCQSRDGEVYPMSEKSVGFNYPPLHPRCRSTVAPYIEGSGRLGSRIARINGKRLHVPETMKYKEFKQKYLTKSFKNDTLTLNKVESAPPATIYKSWQLKPTREVHGGVECTVRTSKEVLQGGLKVDSTVYETADGVKFIFPNDLDKSKQTMTIDLALEAWQAVPDHLRKYSQKKIVFRDIYNPAD